MLRQYCRDVYGPASAPMVAYYELLIERWESTWASASGLTRSEFMYAVKFPSPAMERLKALLIEAEALTVPKTPPYYMVRYVAKGLAPSFFKEVDTYAAADPGKTARTFCATTDQPPVLDGHLDESVWNNQVCFELGRRAWGEPSDRTTHIRLVRDVSHLYVGAEFALAEGQTDFGGEELRIHFARGLQKTGEAYAPNIDKAWDEFRELRITANGGVQSCDRLAGEAAVATDAGRLSIEVRIPLADVLREPDQQVLPIQFMRYWGTWNRFDTCTPAMTKQVAVYPTSRFGLVVFLRDSAENAKDGME